MIKQKLTFDAFTVKAKIQKVEVTALSPYQQSKIIGGADGLAAGTKSPGSSRPV